MEVERNAAIGSSTDAMRAEESSEPRKEAPEPAVAESGNPADGIQPSRSSNHGRPPSAPRKEAGKGYEVVFFKDNVCVHPTSSSSERISGRLMLTDHNSSLSMSWIPYIKENLTEELFAGRKLHKLKIYDGNLNISNQIKNLYTIRGVNFSEIVSIRRHIPPFDYPYVIIVLKSGISFAPLYFHSGGVREFFKHIKNYAHLVTSPDDPHVFLVNDARDPLQRSLSSLKLIRVAENLSSASENSDSNHSSFRENSNLYIPSQDKSNKEKEKDKKSHREFLMKAIQNLKDKDAAVVAKDLSNQLFEKFSLVTKFARDTTNQIFSNDEKIMNSSSISELLPEPTDHKNDKQRNEEKSEPELQSPNTANTSQNDIPQTDNDNDESFEIINEADFSAPHLVHSNVTKTPLTEEEWKSFFDPEGRIAEPSSLRNRIFHGGIEPSLRKEVWKFLLGYIPYSSTYEERKDLLEQKRKEYEILQNQWKSILPEQAKRFAKYRDRVNGIEKDVTRTDPNHPFFEGDDNPNVLILRSILITYSFYNFDLGYCQGMCDLLCPILFIMQDEVEAFWTFACLMDRMSSNFHKDQIGMHAQLVSLSKLVELLDPHLHEYFKSEECLNYYFCFRWVLILFKREFNFDQILRLWEILWTRHLSDYFHLYICVAILKRYRRKIMDERMEFDSLLRFINDLSGKIDLESTLLDAEALCVFAGEKGEACMPITVGEVVTVGDE